MTPSRLWRRGPLALQRKLWRCAGCGALSVVRRLACRACGSEAAPVASRLPATGEVTALSVSGAAFERLDQVSEARVALLVAAPGLSLPCLLAHGDMDLAGRLRGARLRFAVRRMPGAGAVADAPLAYVFKAAADRATRLAIHSSRSEGKASHGTPGFDDATGDERAAGAGQAGLGHQAAHRAGNFLHRRS
jgi:uncharacterized OB-fold protein